MKPKAKTRAEQVLGQPQRMTGEAFSQAMRNLVSNPDFKLLEAQLINIRGEILESGKEKPSEGQWFVLKGFDLAAIEARRWANSKPRSDDMKKRQEELLSILGGEQK